MRRLDGKTAIVTGAGGGIGLATVKRFLDEGANVVGLDRQCEASVIDARLRWIEGDVTDEGDLRRAVEAAKEFGGINICVANAGVGQIERFIDGSRASWSRVFDVNLLGVMLTLQFAARDMISEGRPGRLLATASIAGLRGEAHAPSTAYASSKGAVMALVRSLAMEMASHRITVNAVAPGQIDTAMNLADLKVIGKIVGREASDLRDEFLRTAVPVGRMGAPEEVAGLFSYLASDEAGFVTGTTFRIDGGELAI